MKYTFILFFIGFILLSSCKSGENNNSNAAISTNSNTTRIANLPAPPAEFLQSLYQNTISLDYLFRNTNFSVSQDTPEAIRATLSMMGQEPSAFRDKSCKSPVRITFVGTEGILCDTEMYIDESCFYQDYIIDGTPKYSAKMSLQARNFIQNIIKQASNVSANQ